MAVVRQQVTADELFHMPDDGFRYELVQGELRRMNPAGNVHGRIAVRITWRLAQYVEENRLGTVYAAETGFRLASDPDTVRAPDVAFVSQARVEAVGEVEGFWPEAPDLAVEVVSPGDKVFDCIEDGRSGQPSPAFGHRVQVTNRHHCPRRSRRPGRRRHRARLRACGARNLRVASRAPLQFHG
jgi:hypothetical protein